MSTVTMKIAQILPAAEGKARHMLVGTAPEGHTIKIGCFTEKLGLFQIGRMYDVEVTDGQYKNVHRAVEVATSQSRPAPQQQQAAPLRVVQPTQAANVTPSGRTDKDEQIFVMCALKEFIRAGAVDNNQQAVIREIEMLRGAYRAGLLGEGNTFLASEAGRVASHR